MTLEVFTIEDGRGARFGIYPDLRDAVDAMRRHRLNPSIWHYRAYASHEALRRYDATRVALPEELPFFERIPDWQVWWIKAGLALATFASFAWVWSPLGAVVIMTLIGVHEMGHVYAMRALKVPDRGFVFLPFLGGVAGSKDAVDDHGKSALIALGGPVLGFAVPLAALVGHLLTGSLTLAAAASIAAAINLAQLFPMLPFDGGHITRAVFRSLAGFGERITLAAVASGLLFMLEMKLALLGLCLSLCVLWARRPKSGDRRLVMTTSGAVAVFVATVILAVLHLAVIAACAGPTVRAVELELLGRIGDAAIGKVL